MNIRDVHTQWPEKYRPTTLDDYIGNDNVKEKFQQYIDEQDLPHLLLVGPSGTGKTAAAKILTRAINCDVLILNASDDNNIETVRSKIRTYAATQSFTGFKVIILDEFDGFTRQGQEALRNLMEQFAMNTRFILTANYAERVIDPIVSRTQQFRIVPPSLKQVCVYLAKILKQENVTFDKDTVLSIVNAYYPDIRKVLNEAQSASKKGVLVLPEDQIVNNDFKTKLIELITTKSGTLNTRVNNIRQLLADSDVRDYVPVYRFLFDRVVEYSGSNIAGAIVALADGQYKDSLVPDKEINAMATLINLMSAINT